MRAPVAAAVLAAILAGAGCAAVETAERAPPACTVAGAHQAGAAGQDFTACAGAPLDVAEAYRRGETYAEISREIIRLERLARDIRDGQISQLGFPSRNFRPRGGVTGARRALIAIDDADRLEALNDVRDRIRALREARKDFAMDPPTT